MTGTWHHTVSGLLWALNSDARSVALGRQAAEVARFRRLETELSALERTVLARRHGFRCHRQPISQIARELRVSDRAVEAADARAVALLLKAFGGTPHHGVSPDEFVRPGGASSRGHRREIQRALVSGWRGGCLLCDAAAVEEPLPESEGLLRMPLCKPHVRWAMASRSERIGRQHRHLELMLLAWVKASGQDPNVARRWLGC
jgi:hypothetical protein